MVNWAKFRGVATLPPSNGYDGGRTSLNLSQWIERVSHQARLDRISVAHLRISTRRKTSGG
jgi:hypothetical protein